MADVSVQRERGDRQEPEQASAQYAPDRESLEILRLLGAGFTIDRVARTLGISPRTVRRRVRMCCESLEVDTMVEALVLVARRNLI